MKKLTIRDLHKQFSLEILAGENGMENEITNSDIHSPGLELTGFMKHFPKERVQLLGKQEVSYLRTLSEFEQSIRIEEIVKQLPPCIVITRNLDSVVYLEEHCNFYGVPLLRTEEKTTSFIAKLSNYLDRCLAEETTIHAVCMNVFGIGVLLRGDSGIGKSETALSLINRGHRLISDDIVKLRKIGNSIIGTHEDINRELLSIRGVGIVDVAMLYGTSSVQDETRIILDIWLSHWNEDKFYNGLETEEKSTNYLGINVKNIEVPVKPGRDIATIIEVAVNNYKLQQKGYNALEVMKERISKSMNN